MLHQRQELSATKASATIPNAALKRAAALMQKLIERRNTIPILSYVKVEIAAGRVIMSGTDLDIEMMIELEAETEGEATVMVSNAVLAGLAPITAGPLTLTISAGEARGDHRPMDIIRLSDGETVAELNDHMPVEDYPALKPQGFLDSLRPAFTVSQDQLARLLRLGRHCISSEETRYYLNGMWLTNKPDAKTLRAVTTDGHRMAVIDEDVEADFIGAEDKGLIVHTKSVDLLGQIVGKGGNEPVEFLCGKTFVAAKVGGVTLHTKTIDGAYPDYTRVLQPPSDTLVAHLSGDALRRMCRAAGMMTRNRRTPAALNFAEGRINFSSPSAEAGVSLSMPLQAKRAEGCDVEAIGFNLSYLRDQGAITPAFTLSTANQGAPATIHSDDPSAVWVLMPMRI
ncbi:MAG: hypothetical protein GYB50_20430 [Rhodobacteraceae bacterium]|nr:hypothetical protein [Paracoccaceae bacterium]